MRLVLGTLLLALTGCHTCGRPACGPCGSPGGAACGPIVCVECCHFIRRLDDLHTEIAAKRCACEALARCGPVNCDYRHGFTQAYVDLALGGTGTPPPVPPERYWSVCFRTQCGQDRAADWYAGYRDGVASVRGYESTGPVIPASGAAYVLAPGRPAAQDGYAQGNPGWQDYGTQVWDGIPPGTPTGGAASSDPGFNGTYGYSPYGNSPYSNSSYNSSPYAPGPYGGDPFAPSPPEGWQGAASDYGRGPGHSPIGGYR